MGDTKGFIYCPHCGKPISLTGSVPPDRSCTFWLFMFLLICVIVILFIVVTGVAYGS